MYLHVLGSHTKLCPQCDRCDQSSQNHACYQDTLYTNVPAYARFRVADWRVPGSALHASIEFNLSLYLRQIHQLQAEATNTVINRKCG